MSQAKCTHFGVRIRSANASQQRDEGCPNVECAGLRSAHFKCDCVTASQRKLSQFRMHTPKTAFLGQLRHRGAMKATSNVPSVSQEN